MFRTARRLAPIGVALTLLAACSTGPAGSSDEPEQDGQDGVASGDEAAQTSDSTAAEDAFPVTIEHAFGETTIEQDPERVATVGWVDQDIVVALGEVPVGATEITWGGNEGGSTDWFDEGLAELGADPGDVTRYSDTDGIPADEIAQVQPDLILGTNSGLTEEDYESLSKIAPVVPFPESPWGTPWRDSVQMVGTAIGQPDAAAAVIAETEQAIDGALADHPQLEGTSMAWTWFTASDLSTIGIYTTLDLRTQLMHEFGMVDAAAVQEISEANPGAFSANLSAERADSLDAEVLLFYVEEESQVQALLEDNLISQVPALQSGAYVGFDDMQLMTAITSPTPLSIPVVLEQFLPMVGEAAEQVGSR